MQQVSNEFHLMAQNGVRPHRYGLWISFPKNYDDNVEFAIWDVSDWDGGDLWSPIEDNPIAYWDYYDYYDYTDRVVDMEWAREIDFPYSVQSAIADFTIINYDDYFTPGKGSPIDQYILPKRPFRMYAGFSGASVVQQIVGVTQKMPVISNNEKTAKFHALDFLSEMYTMQLNTVVAMANVRTDEVLAEIFTQFGITPDQYNLAQGRNVIPFVFFDKGKNAGNAFREIMQAEGGQLWLDEQGVIRFDQRLLPIEEPVLTFDDTNTNTIETSGDSEIINHIIIRSDIRKVQDFQPVFSSSDEFGNNLLTDPIIIPANGSKFVPFDLQDPLLSVSTPTLGQESDDSWFTALNGNVPVTTDVSIGLTDLNNNNVVFLFENDNAFPVTIDRVEVWGEPAKIVDSIRYEAYDQDSIDAYGDQLLEIDNNMFGSESNCESFALTILDSYKEFSSIIEMSVKGDPSLQLGDIIEVDTRDFQGTYKIIKISNVYRDNRAEQVIKARLYNPRQWSFWDDPETLWDIGIWAP